jgi:hypothetical protein
MRCFVQSLAVMPEGELIYIYRRERCQIDGAANGVKNRGGSIKGVEQMTRKYIIHSALSGCVWAFIAWALVQVTMGHWEKIVVGMALSPLIGVMIGIIYLPAYRLSKSLQALVSLFTLYLAVSLFGAGSGLYDVFWSSMPIRDAGREMIQSMLAHIWAVTIFGWVVILWPLSYLNHRMLSAPVSRLD